MAQHRRALDANAIVLMLFLTSLWGFQQVAIKVTAQDVTFLMQAAIRSALATVLLLAWARVRSVPLLARDGTFWPGIGAGLLFGGEFVFIYGGLAHTTASRMVVFIYLTPALTALGMHLTQPGERLKAHQWAGVALAFAGIVLAFGEGFATEKETLLGDLCGIAAALLWASTTVLIRATSLAHATATKTLFYQLVVSALLLFLVSVLSGERGFLALTPLAAASLAYQGAIVAFASYLAWFWMLTRYYAAPLSVLTSFTPLFGVLFGVWLLGEPLSGTFAAAALAVGAGIVLVNLRR